MRLVEVGNKFVNLDAIAHTSLDEVLSGKGKNKKKTVYLAVWFIGHPENYATFKGEEAEQFHRYLRHQADILTGDES